MNKAFSNETGLKVFATNLFNFQKTIPQDRYVEKEDCEHEPVEDFDETIAYCSQCNLIMDQVQ